MYCRPDYRCIWEVLWRLENFSQSYSTLSFMAKWRISWPRPSDIVHQKVMILITFHRQSLMNPCAKFQKDWTKALGGVRSNTTPGNDQKITKTWTLTQNGRRTLYRNPGHQETFWCVSICFIHPPNPIRVDETVSGGSSDNRNLGGAVEPFLYARARDPQNTKFYARLWGGTHIFMSFWGY